MNMATVIPRRLFCGGIKLKLPQKSFQPHCCFILTKQEIRSYNCAPANPLLAKNVTENWISFKNSTRLYASTSKSSAPQGREEEEKNLSLYQKLKNMFRDYWYVLIPVEIITSVAWLGGFYYLAKSGVDIPGLLESLSFSEKIVNSMRDSSMGYYAITYALYKIASPVRYAVTLGGTTISINYLKKWGYIKPMPSREQLKEMYVETKEDVLEKKDSLMESVQNLQQTMKDTKDGIKEKKDSIMSSVRESQVSRR